MTIHLLDLAAHCLEDYLMPDVADRSASDTLPVRYWRFRDFTDAAAAGDALERCLRSILLCRYLLMVRLTSLLSEKDRGGDYRQVGEPDIPWPEPNPEPREARWNFETAMAELAWYGAFTSLCLAKGRGDLARCPWLTVRPSSRDRLAALTELVGSIRHLADQCRLPRYHVDDSERHIRELTGRAFEQEMEHLHPGSDVWWEPCLSAADFYCSCGSGRIRVLCAIAQSVRAESQRGPAEVGRGQYDDIIELG